jgi:hypothetical protein
MTARFLAVLVFGVAFLCGTASHAPAAAPGKPVEIYNLAHDLGETRDIAAENPEIVASLEKLMTQTHVESAESPLAAPEK